MDRCLRTSSLPILLAALLAIALSGCMLRPPPPAVPPFPPPDWIEVPVDEVPVEPVDPVEPPEGETGFDAIKTVEMHGESAAWTRREVETLVGKPSQDPPEQPGDANDVVIYEHEGGAHMVVYKAGVVDRVVWTPVGPVR